VRIQKVLTDIGKVERFNGRLVEVIASHHFCSNEDLEKALNHRKLAQAMKD